MRYLVLSLFPGADLFGEAFQREGFCVVRGPDIIYGHDIRDWTPLRNKFDVIIGGPPCKGFSPAQLGTSTQENLIPEFERVVEQAQPKCFVMENVKESPIPSVVGYQVESYLLDAHEFGANQRRVRRFSFGWKSEGLELCPFVPEPILPRRERTPDPFPPVLAAEGKYPALFAAGHKIGRMLTIPEVCELQGVPEFAQRFFLLPRGKSKNRQVYRKEFQYEIIGNGVEMRTGRVVARTVISGLEHLDPIPVATKEMIQT